MSMSDDRTSLARSTSRLGQGKSKAPVAKAKSVAPRKQAAAIPGIDAPGGVLPGLAAFGKMQGFAAPPAPSPAPRPAREKFVPVQEDSFEGFAEEDAFAADLPSPDEQFPAVGSDRQEASFASEEDYEQNDSEFAFSDEDLEALIREGSDAETSGHSGNGAVESVLADDAVANSDEGIFEEADEQSYDFEETPQEDEGEPAILADTYDDAFDKDASRALKTFEAGYDGPPEIRLDAYGPDADEDAPQPFFNDGTESDAAFLDQEFDAAPAQKSKESRGRKYMMVASALVGALALGGAFAFAYKTGGGSASTGDSPPPLIQADARPAKVVPAEPGGKEFPHKNKLIYERLNGAGEPPNEQLVPRQEQVAAANRGLAPQASLRPGEGQKQVATLPGSGDAPRAVASAGVEAQEAPRKVRTLLVRPDGTLVQPPSTEKAAVAPAAESPAPLPLPEAVPVTKQPDAIQRTPSTEPVRSVVLGAAPEAKAEPVPVAPAPVPVPVAEPAAQIPPPLSKPSPPPVAVASAPAAPAPQAAASSSTFVVQVAARKSQADALAAFADLQQKFPDLLSGYRPMIQRADLGERGVWYRLRVGPMNEKTAAANLCDKLKGAGIGSCLVREE